MTDNTLEEDRCCYWNNAGQARLSAAVQLAGVRSVTTRPVPSDKDTTRIRALLAQLIHASPSEIAIVPSTAFAMTLAARNIERLYPEGGKILFLQDQFPSAVYPWQALCHGKNHCNNSNSKWSLDIVRYPEAYKRQSSDWVYVPSSPRNWTEAILTHLQQQSNLSSTESIRVVCIPPLHWSGIGGSWIDLRKISRVCQHYNILLLVDATQAIGVTPLDIQQLLPALAMVTCSSHKWLRGPPGTCLVYINPVLHEIWEPLDQHHRSRLVLSDFVPSSDSRNGMNIPDGYSETFVEDARKFDAGGTPNPILLPMVRTALEEVTQLSLVKVQIQLKNVLQPFLVWAREHGIALSTDSSDDDDDDDDEDQRFYHVIYLSFDEDKTLEKIQKLEHDLRTQWNVYTAVRCGGLRISPYLDTTPEDVQLLIRGLNELLF
jgi:selenocysteine lyase/cysteine desulfurase